MKAKSIERELLNERHAPATAPVPRAAVTTCFMCGRAFLVGRGDGRFCHSRCRDYFDIGGPPYSPEPSKREMMLRFPVSSVIKGQGAHGAIIECAACGKDFESKGLKHCSPECRSAPRRKHKDAPLCRGTIEDVRRICANPGCEGRIPVWRDGKKVRKSTLHCSPLCAKKDRKAQKGTIPRFERNGRRNAVLPLVPQALPEA